MAEAATPDPDAGKPWTFEQVLRDELREIAASRAVDVPDSVG